MSTSKTVNSQRKIPNNNRAQKKPGHRPPSNGSRKSVQGSQSVILKVKRSKLYKAGWIVGITTASALLLALFYYGYQKATQPGLLGADAVVDHLVAKTQSEGINNTPFLPIKINVTNRQCGQEARNCAFKVELSYDIAVDNLVSYNKQIRSLGKEEFLDKSFAVKRLLSGVSNTSEDLRRVQFIKQRTFYFRYDSDAGQWIEG
jgi:hypothetical protein